MSSGPSFRNEKPRSATSIEGNQNTKPVTALKRTIWIALLAPPAIAAEPENTPATGPMAAAVRYLEGARELAVYALGFIGVNYRFGGTSPDAGFDCSGLVLSSYRQIGISLPHYSRAQYSATRRVSRGSLLPGDLVFFFGRGIKHVGIYIGSDRFVHASNPRYGVRVTSLSEPYYLMRISGYGRVVR